METHPILQELKDSYSTRAEGLAQKIAQVQKAQSVASRFSSNLEMSSYPISIRGYTYPHDVLDPTKIIKTISVFEDKDQKSRHFRHMNKDPIIGKEVLIG